MFPRFQLSVWSPCSERCGGGQQSRNFRCVQVVSKDVTNVLPKSDCSHLSKPAITQKCNDIDCLPEWIAGDWTQVSRLVYGLDRASQRSIVRCMGSCLHDF